MEEFNKMLAGVNYNPMNEYLVSLRENTRKKLSEFNLEQKPEKRAELLRNILGKIGNNCYVTPNVFFDYGINTEFGDNVYFNANCVILDCAKVKIGSNVFIGPNVQLYTPIHPIDYKSRNKGIESAKPITIGNNCWLGGSVIVLPGVNIGSGSVIGAGAVVTKDVPKNSLAVGNPARIIRNIVQ